MTSVYALQCRYAEMAAHEHRFTLLMDHDRLERLSRMRSPEKKAQCLGTAVLLQHLFDDKAKLAYDPQGKPYLPYLPHTHINLSHTGEWCFCAVSSVPVGIDAQRITPYRDRIAVRWFTSEERQWVEEDPDVRFTRLWTQREAYAKMTGQGLAKVAMSNARQEHTAREYTDLVHVGIYVAVCTASSDEFATSIKIIKEPLWCDP